jgi:NADH:ubiquinone oxidoreductase subunit C
MEEFLNQLKEDFDEVSYEFETISIKVNVENWISSHELLRDKFDLKYFSWLSAIDWDNEVSVGDAPKEEVTPSFEIVTCLSSVDNSNLITISTTVTKDESVNTFPSWLYMLVLIGMKEKLLKCLELNLRDIPNLTKLYLPDGYEGQPYA